MEITWNTPNRVYLKQYLSIHTIESTSKKQTFIRILLPNQYSLQQLMIIPLLSYRHRALTRPLGIWSCRNQFKCELCDLPLQFLLLLNKNSISIQKNLIVINKKINFKNQFIWIKKQTGLMVLKHRSNFTPIDSRIYSIK